MGRGKIAFAAAALCCAFISFVPPAAAEEAADPDPAPAAEVVAGERYFRFGVLSYSYHWNPAADYAGKERGAFYEEQFRILSENGIDTLHMAVGRDQDFFERLLDLAGRYGIKLLPQLSFAYWQPHWTDAQQEGYAALAADFISRYKDAPQVLAWTVKEEIGAADMPSLLRYYARIRAIEPEVKFWKIHNSLPAMRLHDDPSTIRLANDRYVFRWTVSAGGYLMTPAFGLDLFRRHVADWVAVARELGHEQFWMVINTGNLRREATEADLEEWGEVHHEELPEKVRTWAAEGRFGWSEATGAAGETVYRYWGNYLDPENTVRAQLWITVAEGGTGFFDWSWSPLRQAQLESGRITLAGRPGRRNYALDEFREAAADLEPFDDIIRLMRKTGESPVTALGDELYANGFSLPGLSGRLAVAVNTAVGEWPAGSRRRWRDDDPVYLDGDGNLLGYRPFTDIRACVFELAEAAEGERVFDLAARTALPVDGEGRFTVGIRPGGGRFLFIGTPAEFEQVAGMMGAWVGGGFIPPRRAMELPLEGGPVTVPFLSGREARMRGRCWPADGSAARPVTEPRRSR